MDYIWTVVISAAVGLYGNRYVSGSGYGLAGDVAFATAGGLLTAFLFRMTTISAVVGLIGVLVAASVGAALFLFVRRSFSQA